jgi:hypothetical protein
MPANVWTIHYWPKGQCQRPDNTTVLPPTCSRPEGVTYAEARKQAKSLRFVPAFFGYNIAPVKVPAEGA